VDRFDADGIGVFGPASTNPPTSTPLKTQFICGPGMGLDSRSTAHNDVAASAKSRPWMRAVAFSSEIEARPSENLHRSEKEIFERAKHQSGGVENRTGIIRL
jgi:hypothetical protein